MFQSHNLIYCGLFEFYNSAEKSMQKNEKKTVSIKIKRESLLVYW